MGLLKKRALVVVGMHRSGTSAAAQALVSMGAYFAPPGMDLPPAEENVLGFWERQDVVALNDYALALAGANWRNVAAFRPSRIPAAGADVLSDSIRRIVATLDRNGPWVLKDPRLCLTLPLWQPCLKDPVYVLVIRDPLQVARSLAKRDGIPESVGLALWERYTLDALAATAGARTLTLAYDRLVSNPWGTVRDLFGALSDAGVERLREPSRGQIEAGVRPALHQRDALGDRGTDRQRRLWECLIATDLDGARALGEAGDDETLSRYDAQCGPGADSRLAHNLGVQLGVWVELAERMATLGREAAPRLVAEYVELRAYREDLLQELGRRELIVASAQSEGERLQRAVSDARSECERLQRELSDQERQAQEWQREGLKTRYKLDRVLRRRSVQWAMALDRATVDSATWTRMGAALDEINRGWRYLRSQGPLAFLRRFDEVVLRRPRDAESPREHWHRLFHRLQPGRGECAELAAALEGLPRRPRIAALISCRLGFPETLLDDLARQVLNPEWVILLPRASREAAEELEWKALAWSDLNDSAPFRPKVLPSEQAAALDPGCDYVVLLEAGERLTRDALIRLGAEAIDSDAGLVYCDHDRIGDDYLHGDPELKPAWSPQHLLARDYIEGCYLLPAGAIDPAVIAASDDPSWRYRQLLGALGPETRVRHLARVLWSKPEGECGDPQGAFDAVRAQVALIDPAAKVIEDLETGYRRIRWGLPQRPPHVTLIVPTTGRLDYLEPCVRSVADITQYPAYDWIFLDNGRGKHPEGIAWLRERGLRVIECDEPFNWSRLNNIGAREARGDYLLFLNDDIEVTDPHWLSWLVSHACRPGVGCVGALLYYPSGEIQHDGMFLVDHGGGARHWFHRMAPGAGIYRRLERVTREVTVVTGACLLVGASLFRELGGFDEEFVVTHNDVDFCLRAAARGRRNLVVADTSLIHHEAVHRGYKSSPNDDRRMWGLWGDALRQGDAFHNLQFVKYSASCAIRFPTGEPPAVPAADALGVNCVAYVSAEMGLGEAARGILASLEAAGVSVDAIDYRRGNPSRCGDRRWCHRIQVAGRHSISLYIVNADWLPTVKRDVQPQLPREGYAIGYWAWELSEFPARWRGSFDLVDEIWVASEHVRGGVARWTDKPVFVVPNPVRVEGIGLPGRDRLGIPEDVFAFLTLFDVNSVVGRKNPLGAIDAFDNAFGPDDVHVHLVIKINNMDASTRALLDQRLAGRRNATVIDRVLTRREMLGLFQSCDVLVSLHRAEGFGLPPAEAMALGKVAIATGYSGNLDYMDDSNSLLVPYDLVKVGADQGPYDKGAVWAEPDIEAAASAMRRVAQDPEIYRALSRRAWCSVRARLSPPRVGCWIESHLREIQGRLPARSASGPAAGAGRGK